MRARPLPGEDPLAPPRLVCPRCGAENSRRAWIHHDLVNPSGLKRVTVELAAAVITPHVINLRKCRKCGTRFFLEDGRCVIQRPTLRFQPVMLLPILLMVVILVVLLVLGLVSGRLKAISSLTEGATALRPFGPGSTLRHTHHRTAIFRENMGEDEGR